MQAIFFACPRADAIGVGSVDDLPCDPAGEPVRIESPGVLAALARTLGQDDASAVRPLRDATCRSFPVFEFARGVPRALAALPEPSIDEAAENWLADESWQGGDMDLYETACLLSEIRRVLRESDSCDTGLFVLLEESAL